MNYQRKLVQDLLSSSGMKKKTKAAKLNVKKETIRNLSDSELKETGGGIIVPTVNQETQRCQDYKIAY